MPDKPLYPQIIFELSKNVEYYNVIYRMVSSQVDFTVCSSKIIGWEKSTKIDRMGENVWEECNTEDHVEISKRLGYLVLELQEKIKKLDVKPN